MNEIVAILGKHVKHRRDQVLLSSLSRALYAAYPIIRALDPVILHSDEQARSFRTWLIRHGHELHALDLTFKVIDTSLLGVLCTLMHITDCRCTMLTSIEPFFLESMVDIRHFALNCQNLTIPCWYMKPQHLTSLELTVRGMMRADPFFGTAFNGLRDLRITAKDIHICSYPPSLTRLELHGRVVQEAGVYALRDLPHLQHLALTHSRLSFLPDEMETLTGLTHLDLSHNCLSSYDPEGFMYHDVLASLANMTSLQSLDLSYNEMDDATVEELAECRLGSLTTLDISHNSDTLTRLTAQGSYLSNLKHLYASVVPSSEFFDQARHLEEFTYRSNARAGAKVDPVSLVSLSFRPMRVTMEGSCIPTHHVQSFFNLIAADTTCNV